MVVDKWLPIATSALGPKDDLVVGLNENRALCKLGTKLIWTAAWRTMNDILAMKRRVYGKRHPKTLQTEGSMLRRREVHRRVIEDLIQEGSWSYVVAVRRAFVRLLKKP